MILSDRYSCQEHGTDKHEDCIACEVYGDIAELVERIAELETQLTDAHKWFKVIRNYYGISAWEAYKNSLKEIEK